MQIPLFPLHTVLCPGIALPLHIFEPRYRLMVERLVPTRTPFGIVLIREGREAGGDSVSIAGVGTFAEIREARRLPDGRYELLVVGSGRFAITSVDTDVEPYLVADVVPLDDEVGDEDRVNRISTRLMGRFVDYLHLLQPEHGETGEELDVRIEIETDADDDIDEEPVADRVGDADDPFVVGRPPSDPPEREVDARGLRIPEDPTVLSYLLSGIVQVDPLQRQVLLEAETTEDRLRALAACLDRELWLLRQRLRLYTPDPSVAALRRN